jgi:hypothetical protein
MLMKVQRSTEPNDTLPVEYNIIPIIMDKAVKTKINLWVMIITLVLITTIALAWSGGIDKAGDNYVDQAFKRATVTFAVSRALNGVISVAQGTEFAIQPAGVGINFTPGQILDPINDLLERFSWIMLLSSTSLGVQSILLEIFSSPLMTALVTLACLVMAALVWGIFPKLMRFRGAIISLTLVVILLRFLIPLIAWSGEVIHESFLQPRYQTAVKNLKATQDKISDLNQTSAIVNEQFPAGEAADSIWDQTMELFDQVESRFDFSAKLEGYRAASASASENMIELIAIFVFQTVLLPLSFLMVIRMIYRIVHRIVAELIFKAPL